MQFNEKTHAYLAAKYYYYLTEYFDASGEKAFIHATQYYAQQRGRRMAQRAIRDGKELTYETYLQYGEWIPTEEMIRTEQSNVSEVKHLSPHFETHIYRCPWHSQFKEMDLVQAGHVYCQHLDNSIARGFNPYIDFKVEQTLHKDDYCIHIISDVHYDKLPDMTKNTQYLKDFEYHCAHLYWSFAEVTETIFLGEGRYVSGKVLSDFVLDHTQGMSNKIMTYKNTNFNVCD